MATSDHASRKNTVDGGSIHKAAYRSVITSSNCKNVVISMSDIIL